MVDVSELKVKVSLITDDFRRGLKEVASGTEDMKNDMERTASSTEKASKSMSKFGLVKQVFGSFSGTFKKTTKGIDGVSSAFKGLGTGAMGMGASLLAGGAIAGIAAMGVVSALKKVYETMKELVSFASPEEYQQSSMSLKQSVANFKQVLGTALTPVFQAMQGALKGVVEFLTQVAFGLIQISSYVSAVFGLANAFEGLSTSVDSATAGFAAFDKVTTINDSDQYSADLSTIKEMSTRIQDAKKAAQDTVKVFSDIGQWFGNIFSSIGSWWGSFTSSLGGWWSSWTSSLGDWWSSFTSSLGQGWSDFTSSLGQGWSSFVTKAGELWSGFVDSIQSIGKTIGNFFIGILNSVVSAYNNTIGSFRIDNDMLNIHFGFPRLDSIPQLKYGGVVSPGMPFITGDNTREKEAVAPLSSLQSMITEAVRTASSSSSSTTIPVTIQLNGRTLASAMYEYNVTEESRRISSTNGRVRS